MFAIARSDATFFSLAQLEVMTSWNAARPFGFGLCIRTDHENCPEMAEVYKHDRMSPLWFLNATQAGTTVITRACGLDEEVGTVEQALARVLELEA